MSWQQYKLLWITLKALINLNKTVFSCEIYAIHPKIAIGNFKIKLSVKYLTIFIKKSVKIKHVTSSESRVDPGNYPKMTEDFALRMMKKLGWQE